MSAYKFSNIKKFTKGSVIVQEGDHSKELILLLQGNVGVYRNYKLSSEAQLFVLGQGDFHGEMSLFLGREPQETLVAISDTVLFAVNRKNMQEFFVSQPDMTVNIIEKLCKKLDQSNTALERYTLANLKQTESKKSSLFPEGHGSYLLEMDNSNRDLLYEQKVTCPLCDHSFIHLTCIASKLRQEKTESDLRVRYKDIEPLHYEIITCPNCFYSATTDAFPKVSKRWQGEINQKIGPYRLDLEIKPGMYRDSFTVFAGYYLAILCGSLCFDDHQMITGGLWIKLSRLYNDCGDEAMLRYASEKSLGEYLYAYEHFNISEKLTQQLCYVIGDLYFKLNDYDTSRNFFYLAKTNREGSNIMKMQADRRLEEIKELKKK